MTDPTMGQQVRALVAPLTSELKRMQRKLDALEAGAGTSQLTNASVTGTTITVYDDDGETPLQSIGKQTDGTVGIVAVNGPVPPTPSTPLLTPGQLSLTVSWDGAFTADQARTADTDHVGIHTSASSGFTPDETTLRGTLAAAGDFVVQPLAAALTYVVLVAVTTSAVVSVPSAQASATPLEVTASDVANSTIPGVPTLVTPFVTAAYLDAQGLARAKLTITWTEPANTDATPITDGSHYEIRYAADAPVSYPATWEQVSSLTWDELATWDAPLPYPDGSKWTTVTTPWDDLDTILDGLAVGVAYKVQIRAVDKARNVSAWSATETVTAGMDATPPSEPAAPSVAGSLIAVQVAHQLGKASGGSFNLEADLAHLEIHVDYEPHFTPSDATLKGKVSATAAMLQAQVPAITTVSVGETSARYVRVVAVDITGNKSSPSAAASSTALLIDDAHISDLTVTKVTAGTISADWIVGARIKTANAGTRVELNSFGLQAYDDAGTQTVDISAATGDVSIIGEIASGVSGDRVIVNPAGSVHPEVRFYPSVGNGYGRIYSQTKTDEPTEMEMFLEAGPNAEGTARSVVQVRSGIVRLEVDDENGVYDTGGRIDVAGNYVEVGFPPLANNPNYFRFIGSGTDDRTYHVGKWDDFVDRGANTGIFTGSISGASGGFAVAISYGTTSTSQRLPIVSINDDGAPNTAAVRAFHTTTVTSSGFTVELSGTATGGWSVYFWSFRI